MNILILFTVLLIGKTRSKEIEFKNTLPINRVNFNEDVLFRNRDNVCINPEKYGFSEKIGTRNYFSISDRLMTWSEGENYCQSFGAHLPIIKSHDENNYLRTLIGRRVWTQAEYGSTISTNSGYWLGAYKSVETNTFKWIDNSQWTFTNWKTNEPSFDGKIQFYVHDIYNMVSSEYEGWDDQSAWTHSFVICQLDCSSTTSITTLSTPTTVSIADTTSSSATEITTTIKPTDTTTTDNPSNNSTVDHIFNFNLQSTITNYGSYIFEHPSGIKTVVIANQTYFYVTDSVVNQIVILNQTLHFVKLINHVGAFGIASSNQELYVGSEQSITKYDFNLNLIKNISKCSFTAISGQCLNLPRGLSYDLNANLLYDVDYFSNCIHVFDEQLVMVKFIYIPNYPISVVYFNNTFYVATFNNLILTFVNESMDKTYSNICPTVDTPINSIYIYNQQYFLFSCSHDNIIVIYELNMTYTGKYLSTSGSPTSITSDSQNRILVTNEWQGGIDIFTI